jgi:hypothetical protein
MWHHVTNHLIISTDKDSNSESRIKLRVRDSDRDACVDMGLEGLLRVIECAACNRRVMNRTSLTKLGWACVQ